MPQTCSVPSCKGNYKTGPRVKVFSFPKEEPLRHTWLKAIKRETFRLTKNSKVCELHFKESDFETEVSAYDSKTGKTLTAPLSIKRLKKNVVPSLHIPSAVSDSSSRENPEQKRLRLEQEQLGIAMEQSLLNASAKNYETEDNAEASSYSSSTENEVTNSLKKKGRKRKGASDDVERTNKAVNGFSGIAYSVKQLPNQSTSDSSSDSANPSSDSVNPSTKSLPVVQIKDEPLWDEGYNYIVNTSSNSDTVKITSVQSCATVEPSASEQSCTPQNEKEVSSEKETTSKPGGICDIKFYKKPLSIDRRDFCFGQFVACEMSDLRSNPELYLKTKDAIQKLLVEAHFDQISASKSICHPQ